MFNVVLAYEDSAHTLVEQEILRTIDATVFHFRDTDALAHDALAGQVDALMVGTERVTANLLASMPRCRIVSRVGVGLDAIDLAAATERGVWVTNVPDFPVDEVSTHAIALLLAHARRLPKLFEQARQGIWDSASVRPFARLKGQTVGVLGFGRIGQAFARKAQGLGLQVIAYDPYLDVAAIETHAVRAADWETLLRASDFLSLHAPLTNATRRIVNASALAQMKPTAFIINTARGGLIDAEALLQAVRAGQIGGAALDVFDVEPLPSDHPLFHEERILITPHIAWYSEDSMRDVKVRAAEEVVRVLRGGSPRCPVNQVNSILV